jgi:MFS family permease
VPAAHFSSPGTSFKKNQINLGGSFADRSQEFNSSHQAVSLTITSYQLMQGFAPLIWGALSDKLGRRQVYVYSFMVYLLANIVLSFSPNLAVLFVFRGLQAFGSASVISIGMFDGPKTTLRDRSWLANGIQGNGVVQDIALPAERGGFMSTYQACK